MNQAILRSLLWKEWREVQWKAVALLAIALAVYAAAEWEGQRYGSRYADAAADVAVYTFMYVMPMAGLFLGMGVAAGEREAGTSPLLGSLPVRPVKVLAMKLTAATLAALMPVLSVGVLVGLLWLIRETEPAYSIKMFQTPGYWPLIVLGLALSVLIWTVAVGIRQPTQVRAGLIGLATLVMWGLLLILARVLSERLLLGQYVKGNWEEVRSWRDMLMTIPLLVSPFGFAALAVDHPWMTWQGMIPITVGVQGATWMGLIAWSLRGVNRLEADERGAATSAAAAPAAGHVSRRLSRTGAIVWFQWRRVRPIVLVCVLLVLGMAAFMLLDSARGYRYYDRRPDLWRLVRQQFQEGLVYGTWVWSSFAAAFLGIGVFAVDGQRRVDRFWRAQAISSSLWFWVRYATGAGALLLALDGTVYVICAATGMEPVARSYLTCAPIMHLFFYTLAVMLMCLLRHPVYAGILTIALGLSAFSVGWLIDGPGQWVFMFDVMDAIRYWDYPILAVKMYLMYAAFYTGLTALAAWVGYVAIKKDIRLAAA